MQQFCRFGMPEVDSTEAQREANRLQLLLLFCILIHANNTGPT